MGGEGAPAEKKERTSWTRAEDDVIIQGVSELGHKWYEIARRLPGRTDHAIRNRWSRLQSIMGMQETLGTDSSQQRVLPPPIGSPTLAAAAVGATVGAAAAAAVVRQASAEGMAVVRQASADGMSASADMARRHGGAHGANPLAASPSLRAANNVPPPSPNPAVQLPAQQPSPAQPPPVAAAALHVPAAAMPSRSSNSGLPRSANCTSPLPSPASGPAVPPVQPLQAADGGACVGPPSLRCNGGACPSVAATAPTQAPLSIAALANVQRLGGTTSFDGTRCAAAFSPVVEQLHAAGAPPICMDVSRTSAGSEGSAAGDGSAAGSDAELTTGTAELLLLQSGSASGSGIAGAGSCQPSPQIGATAKAADECPVMPDDAMVTDGSAEKLLLLSKRPRSM